MLRRFTLLLLTLGALIPNRARAEHFHFIYADQITMRAPLASWGITLAGSDFGLLVNKGTTNLTADILNAAEFRVDGIPVWPDTLSPTIDPALRPGFNSGYVLHPSFVPIAPNVAAGSVGPLSGLLPSLLGAGENLQDTSPAQFIYFQLDGTGNSPGVVRFDVHLRIGDEWVHFPMFVTLIDSPTYLIEFTHVARVVSALPVTAARTTTWGRLKQLYR